MEKNNTRIISIDVGLATTGWAIIQKSAQFSNKMELIEYGPIITEAGLEMGDRLEQIFTRLSELIDEFEPIEMAIESLFFFKNQK
ncbi:MAG: crossover junction endodeoxyribonuclease RuvC, partial [Candidatus Dojkabacteria bacterium]|nr:crossover junction endodeoxyribonuclease RuvC [Candidatus Dojkabacteria bacterium]